MEIIKKSLNLNPTLASKLADFITKNPGVSFTLIVNQALEKWLENPSIKLTRTPFTDEEVDKFLEENSELMKDLAK